MKRNIYVIIDGQAGDCGKGKAFAEFALQYNPELAITNHMPNADHTCVINGQRRMFRNIPVSSVNPSTALFLGSGVFINMDILEQEYYDNLDLLDGREIIAHPNIALIEQRHIDYEREVLKKSGSTFNGGGACLSEKIMRSTDLNFFKGYKSIRVVSHEEYFKRLKEYLTDAKRILLEGSQGCDLDINHSGHYPHTTSKQISVAQMLADSGISPRHLKDVTMIIRPFPIRIAPGNYGKSKELSWDRINISSSIGTYPIAGEDLDGMEDYYDPEHDYTEIIPHSGEERRVFDIDIKQLKRNIQINTPDSIYLNFFQHLDNDYEDVRGTVTNFNSGRIYFEKPLREYLYWLEDSLGVPITKLGTGAENGSYIKVLKR